MILILGGTGKIGREVIRLLTEASIRTRALVRDPKKTQGWKNVEVVPGDLNDAASIDRALKGVDTLLLLTNANSKQELAVIAAAQRAGLKKIVKISSMGADLDSKLTMARGHAASEEALKASGLAWTILRPGMFAQNFLQFAASIKKSGRFFASTGKGKAATIDARDIAAVAVRALTLPEHDGKTYFLTGSEPIDYATAAKKIGKVIGKDVTYVDVPIEQTKQAMIDNGLPEWLAEELALLQVRIAANESGFVSEDVERILGRPPLGFDDFARDYASAFE